MLADETLGRFACSSSDIKTNPLRVRPKLFEPSEKDLALSLLRVSGLRETEIWEWGHRHIENRSIYGRAELPVSGAGKCGLEVRIAEPPPLHVEIVGWSLEKSERVAKALELRAMVTAIVIR